MTSLLDRLKSKLEYGEGNVLRDEQVPIPAVTAGELREWISEIEDLDAYKRQITDQRDGMHVAFCAKTDEALLLHAENSQLQDAMNYVRQASEHLDQHGMKPGWGVARDLLHAAINRADKAALSKTE